MSHFSLSTAAPALNLKRLLIIRGLFLLVVGTTLAISHWFYELPLAYPPLLWILSALTLVNAAAVLQLHHLHHVSALHFTVQLLVDIIAITLLLYFSGGANNPFVSYYLVPLCIAAATLNWRFIWPLLALALILYTSLFYFHVPLEEIAPQSHQNHQNHQSSAISLHTLGMWFNFLISALLIAFFVARLAASHRSQNDLVIELREQQLRDDQLLAVATLAASTAHELGSPLTTMKTLLKEMQFDAQTGTDVSQLQQDLSLLQHQVVHCSDTLQHLTNQAREFKDGVFPTLSAQDYCQKIVDNWLLLRPEVRAKISYMGTPHELQLQLDPTIGLSINNLLNNAADANPMDITVTFCWSVSQLIITILDNGHGIDKQIEEQLGQAFTSIKGEGRGLGLFLTSAAIERLNGSIHLENRAEGGTLTRLSLPLNSVEKS